MIKRLSVFAALVALIIGAVVAPGSAASTVTQNFLLTSPGATPVLAFSGQLQCEVQINGPNSSIAATPQYSADGVTWHAASWRGASPMGHVCALELPLIASCRPIKTCILRGA